MRVIHMDAARIAESCALKDAPLENLQAIEKVPKPVSSGSGFLETILALESLDGVSNVVLAAHADKIRIAIIFEPNHGGP
jgi:hypothetical protein